MPLLTGVRLPVDWAQFGFGEAIRVGDMVLANGRVAWSWDPTPPDFGIASFSPPDAEGVLEWGIDHVVLVVPDMDDAVATLQGVGADLRLRTIVRDRPTAFFRVGTVLEVIQVDVPVTGLYGVALVTTEPLEVVAARWRANGHEVSDPKDAIQPGRRIMTVRGVDAGLAVMSPDTAR